METQIQSLSHAIENLAAFSAERGIDYLPLQQFLSAGKWREADRETHSLLLQAIGRKGDRKNSVSVRVRSEEFRSLPCEDLYVLDYLWVHHSNGWFGFSVQKDLWYSVGGTTEGYETWEQLTHSKNRWRVNTPWDRFGQRVGWRVKEHWLPPSQLTFSPDAAKGHLPHWQMTAPIAALFARLEVCQPYIPRHDITLKP